MSLLNPCRTGGRKGTLHKSNLSSFMALRSCSEAVHQLKKPQNYIMSSLWVTILQFWSFFSTLSNILTFFCFIHGSSVLQPVLLYTELVEKCFILWGSVRERERGKKKKETAVTLCILALHKAVIHTAQHSAHTSGQKGFSIGNPPTLSWTSALGVALLNNDPGGDFGGSRTCLGWAACVIQGSL